MTEHPPIRLDDWVLVNDNTTLREIIRVAIAIAGKVGETRPLTEQDTADITEQVTEWIRTTRPVCGATLSGTDTTPPIDFEFSCTLSGFHEGNEHSADRGDVVWTSDRTLGKGHLAPRQA